MICCRCGTARADGYVELGKTLFMMCPPCGEWIGKHVPNAKWELIKEKKK